MASIKKTLLLLALGLIGILIQGTLLRQVLVPSWVMPSFLIIFVVYLAFYEATPLGAILAFALGLEFDLASGELIGPHAASMAVVFGFLSSITQRIFVDSVFAVFLAVFVSSMFSHLVYVILLFEFKPSKTLFDLLIEFSLPEAFVTALLAPIVFSLLRKVVTSSQAEQFAYS